MSDCQHKEHPICDNTCVCTCDSCQEQFEAEWSKRATEDHLCEACGMPVEMSLERLKQGYTIHFFQPCDTCKPAFLTLMKQHKMCPTCQQDIQGDRCADCFCTEQPSTCVCRQCKAYRKSLEEE